MKKQKKLRRIYFKLQGRTTKIDTYLPERACAKIKELGGKFMYAVHLEEENKKKA